MRKKRIESLKMSKEKLRKEVDEAKIKSAHRIIIIRDDQESVTL